MHARVTQMRLLPGKVEQFKQAIGSVLPAARKQSGFRALLILETGEADKPEATAISIWDTLEDLRASEGNMFYYDALARLYSCCDGYPLMHEQEVLVGEFAALAGKSA